MNIRNYRSSSSSKVVDLGANRKCICNFLSVINSNFGRISYRFLDIDAFTRKQLVFHTPTLFDAPRRRNAMRYPGIICTVLKCSSNGLHFIADNTGLSSFPIFVALVGSQISKVLLNSKRIWTSSRSRSSRYWHLKLENGLFSSTLSCLMPHLGRTC